MNVIIRTSIDHVDHCHTPSHVVSAEQVLEDIAFYGTQSDYVVSFDRETIDNDNTVVTVIIDSLETTTHYEWIEND